MDLQERQAEISALEMFFGEHPTPIFALGHDGKIFWKNRVCRGLFPTLRLGAYLARYFDVERVATGGTCVTFCNETYFLCREAAGEGYLCFLQKLHEAFYEEFREVVSAYSRGLLAMVNEGLSASKAKKGSAVRRRHLAALCARVEEAECATELFDSLCDVRVIREGRPFAVSAGEMLEFFAKNVRPALEKHGIRLHLNTQSGVVALLNFRDFTRALLYVMNFFITFVQGREIDLSLAESEGGECVFTVSAEDEYDILFLYRYLVSGRRNPKDGVRESAVFFPLFCALRLFSAYSHRVKLAREGTRLVLRVFAKTSLEFPNLVVRDDEECAQDFVHFKEDVQRFLYSTSLAACLSHGARRFTPVSLQANVPVEANLFD